MASLDAQILAIRTRLATEALKATPNDQTIDRLTKVLKVLQQPVGAATGECVALPQT